MNYNHNTFIDSKHINNLRYVNVINYLMQFSYIKPTYFVINIRIPVIFLLCLL